MKAEINRQLGNFNRCIELLLNVNNSIATQIREHAQNYNPKVFQLS